MPRIIGLIHDAIHHNLTADDGETGVGKANDFGKLKDGKHAASPQLLNSPVLRNSIGEIETEPRDQHIRDMAG